MSALPEKHGEPDEPERGGEVVPFTGAVDLAAQLAEAERHLADLVERSDTEGLGELRLKAAVAQEWQRREGFREQADHFGKLKIMAEAALGAVDLRANGMYAKGGFVVDERQITRFERDRWRLAAIGVQRGLLTRAFTELVKEGREITTTGVYARLSSFGTGHVPRRQLAMEFRHWSQRTGGTAADIARALGWNHTSVSSIVHDTKSSPVVVLYPRAIEFARAIELDVARLKVGPRKIRRRRRRARKVPAAIPRTGGRWDETDSLIQRALVQLGRVAGNADPRYDELYAHLYAAHKIVRPLALRNPKGT